MFYVYLWDPRSSTSNLEKFVTISGIADVKGASLDDVRKKLTGENALEWRQYVVSPFAITHGDRC